MSATRSGRRAPASAALLAALLVAAAACRTAPVDDRRPPDLEDRTHPTSYSLSVGGAVEATLRREAVPVRVVSLLDPRLPTVTVFSLNPVQPVEAGGGIRLLGGFDLVGFKGDGRYTIGPGAASPDSPGLDPARVAKGLSHARLVFMGRAGAPRVFDVVVKACTVEIRSGGRAGTLTCERLADSDGKAVFLEMVWRW